MTSDHDEQQLEDSAQDPEISFRLLDLPHEIIEHILCFLPPVDLLTSWMVVDRFFLATITKSVQIQHYLALYVSGMEDNPKHDLSMVQRLDHLMKREDAWMKLKPTFVRSIPCPFLGGGLYDVTNGVLFLGDITNRTHLFYLRLPSTPDEDAAWMEFEMKELGFIVDFGLSSNDELIALVTL
jgi:hypothetical protein